MEKKNNGTDPSTVTNGVIFRIVQSVFAFGPLPTIKFLIRLSKGKGLDPPGFKFQSCLYLKQQDFMCVIQKNRHSPKKRLS